LPPLLRRPPPTPLPHTFPTRRSSDLPSVDAGQLRMHVRAPPGTRLEETQKYYAQVEDAIRQIIPPNELGTIIDNIGIPNSTINLDRKSTRLNSSHEWISYAVFCLKKK